MKLSGTMALGMMLVVVLAACSTDAVDEAGSGSGNGTGGGSNSAAGGAGGAMDVGPVDCVEGDKPGSAEGAVGELTAGGIRYNVWTPDDYLATRAHPLLVVYSPRVTNAMAEKLEVFTGLGPDATARGYVTAFVEWFDPVVAANRADADTIRVDIANKWCVEPTRVFLAGHSDGGSMATLYALDGPSIAAVAPSAAGIDEDDGPAFGCNGAIPAMVIHSADDMIFPAPNFGLGAASFWAGCSSCGALGAPDADGCADYSGCAEGSEVRYCETSGSHYQWYGLNAAMLDFFDRHALAE